MSDDSDLEFESADEDETFGKTSENKTTESHSPSETVAPVKTHSPSEHNENTRTHSTKDIGRSNPQKDEPLTDMPKPISESDDVSEGPSDSVLETPKERVMLRLEKKKQQKSLLKDSPKEKPSDLINILEDNSQQQSSWGWGDWGTTLLSTAASSVSTFSNQVSQGIGTVIETVENTLGAPPPEQLATILNEKKGTGLEAQEDEITKQDSGLGLLPDISSWTKVFENTGNKVISGGLDTLEFIGKKTMDILTESDPGLRKKRSAFSNASNLSELMKEIKARSEEKDKGADPQEVHYSQVFDEKQGLVHLEALEMLSKQSEAKHQRLLMKHSKDAEVKRRLKEIRSICSHVPCNDDLTGCESFKDFDFETVFRKHSLELGLPLNVENIIKMHYDIDARIKNFNATSEESHCTLDEVFRSGIYSLAEFTAKCIETFHKVAELVLVQASIDTDLEHCATNLTALTNIMCIEVSNISSQFCLQAISQSSKSSNNEQLDVTTLSTNFYLEASNSNAYIQDAYQMLIPVLQVRLLETID